MTATPPVGTADAQAQTEHLRQALSVLLEAMAGEVRADAATLFLYDAGENVFDLPVVYGLRDPDTVLHPRFRPRTSRVAGKIVRQGRAIAATRVAGHPALDGAFARREGICSTAGFPLKTREGVIGVLFVSYRAAHAFTPADRRIVNKWIKAIVAAVAQADALPLLRRLRSQPSDLQRLADLVCTVTNLPVAIWILDPRRQTLGIQAMSGLTHRYQDAVARLGDGSIIDQVMQTGRAESVPDLCRDSRFHYPAQARDNGWTSSLAFPIRAWGKPRGVIEVFALTPRKFDTRMDDTFYHLAELAGTLIEKMERERDSYVLADITDRLSKTLDFGQAMQIIVEGAHELLGTSSSTLFLYNKWTNEFTIGARFPARLPARLPRPDGLSRRVVETGEMIAIHDTRQDPRVRQAVLDEGTCALVGVRVRMKDDKIGVLWVSGEQPGQFTGHDQLLLETLANQVSVALGWARFLLRLSDEIEDTTARLFERDTALADVCEDIQASLKFEFAAIQLVRPEAGIVETVSGYGVSAAWIGQARHSLEDDPALRDIQADIVLKKTTLELISGWDDRFDPWLYRTHGHERFTRVFAPLMLVRDPNGTIVPGWFERCRWTVGPQQTTAAGQRTTIEMAVPPGWTVEVLGTVEAGYSTPGARIELEDARRLAELAARHTPRIYESSLASVLEVIATRAMQIVQADSASLHFRRDARQQQYVYEMYAGQKFARAIRPREDGLGQRAIRSDRPQFVSDPAELERHNPAVFKEGIRAMAAFPLRVEQEVGVLYIHFRREHRFSEDEIRLIQLLTKRAADAVRFATSYLDTQARARQLDILQSATQSLAIASAEHNSDLPDQVAWYAINLLAADVVTLYEYRAGERRFFPPTIAGRLRNPQVMHMEIGEGDVPARLVRHNENVYAPHSAAHSILNPRPHPRPLSRPSFVDREGIIASAGILLKVHDDHKAADEIVGIMFVNFRRENTFAQEERHIIESLASSMAIAIRNRQLRQTLRERHQTQRRALQESAKAVTTSAERQETLQTILETAARLTAAHFATIQEKRGPALYFEAVYPAERKHTLLEQIGACMPLDGPGLTVKVANLGAPCCENDVDRLPGYVDGTDGRTRSELAVPMFEGATVWGVLNVEHSQAGAFDEDDVEALTVLASIAAAALNLERAKQQAAFGRAVNWLRLMNFTWVHGVRNKLIDIRDLAAAFRQNRDQEDLLEEIEKLARTIAEEEALFRDIPGAWHKLIDAEGAPVEIAAFLAEQIEAWRTRFGSLDIELRRDEHARPRVKADPLLLRWALEILAENAAEATADARRRGQTPAERLSIEVRRASGKVDICFCDNGSGIPPELREDFGRRPLPIRPGQQGLGIGAALVSFICQGLGGEFRIADYGPSTTTIVMSLPEDV